MIGQQRFVRDFEAGVVHGARDEPDFRFIAEHAGARATRICVEPLHGASWVAAFGSPDPDTSATSGLFGTPSPTGLCVVERGTAFLGDVLRPDRFTAVKTAGPVVAAYEVASEDSLLLVTPWAITAIGREGVLWTTERIAIDGLRIDEVAHGWLRGVSDPDDEEPGDFAVEIATGRLVGGTGIH